MTIDKIKERIAKNVQERTNLELEMIKRREAEKEAILLDKKREALKRQTQIDHESYLRDQQRLRDQKEYEKSDIGKERESFRYARDIRDREISEGLTWEERKYKHMDEKTRRDCDNAIVQGEAKDIRDFLRKKRQKQEASERRKKYLKGS